MPNTPNRNPGSDMSSADTSESLDRNKLQSDATDAMDEAKSAATKVANEARHQAGEIADEAREQLGQAAEKAKSMAGDQKELLANQVSGVAEAIDKVASELEGGDSPSASYARLVADNATKLSDKLQNADVDELLSMAQDFGRKQPAAFMGAAALLGFAASRFVLASAKRHDAQSVAPATEGYTQADPIPQPNGSSTSPRYDTGRI